MKHVRRLSSVPVKQAEMGAAEIMTLIATILSGVGAALLAISPLVGDKD
ncbi:MAG TPA: hypothetical protein PLO37_14590 [Candidatus Hydrogenedentes bacterium]|nr:hypothetical protein [Candidatus Hydrogenedentota bacterium]HPG68075.1 hypothetical protein [Candidatus Hydrogenedentota bacterium]